MTTPTNWPNPERPGVPMFPERDGLHALDTGQFIHVCHWYAKQKWWERKPNTDIAHEPKHFSHFLYIGPVLTLAQIAEMLAGERERIKNMVSRACNLGNIITVLQRDMIIAGIDSETAIRNLGAAP